MDDTSFLDGSREYVQEFINLDSQFYHIHDVNINGKRSELIVINPTIPKEHLQITIGRDYAPRKYHSQ